MLLLSWTVRLASSEQLGHIHHLGRRLASGNFLAVLQLGIVAIPFVHMTRVESPLGRVGQTVLFIFGLVDLVEPLLGSVPSGRPEDVEQVVNSHRYGYSGEPAESVDLGSDFGDGSGVATGSHDGC